METLKKDFHRVTTKWRGNMHFESAVNDHVIHLDKMPQHGGENFGPRPKPLILAAVGGCTGMEVLAILEKMRLRIEMLEIDVTGELNDGQPKIYKAVHLIVKVKAGHSPVQKVERAILLATEKYCSVVAMVRHFAAVTTEIIFL